MSTGSSSSGTAESVSDLEPLAKRHCLSNGRLDNMLIRTERTTKEMQDKIDNQLARFFFSANIPFISVQDDELVKLFDICRKGYTPPSRKVLGTTLLEQVHDQVSDSIKVNVADKKYIILSQDGWSNNSNTPFLAHSFFKFTIS